MVHIPRNREMKKGRFIFTSKKNVHLSFRTGFAQSDGTFRDPEGNGMDAGQCSTVVTT